MEGVSSHFDHVTGRHVMGQQVLTLGLATEEPSCPWIHRFTSVRSKPGIDQAYKDGRSVAAKRYQ